MQWPRSALPSAEETDEEVVWNGAPAQQDLLMTESEDDSEVALLQMLGISSDLDDEFVDSDGESEADQQALQMKTRESTEKERRMEEWLQQLCHEVDKLQATSSWLTVGLQQALGAVDNLELCLQQQIQLTEQLQELHRMQLEAGFSHADTEYERTEEFKNASRRKTSKKSKIKKTKKKKSWKAQKKRRSDILQKKARSEQQKDDQGWLGAVAAAVLLLVSAFACLCLSGNLG